jgi:hypothetical protein
MHIGKAKLERSISQVDYALFSSFLQCFRYVAVGMTRSHQGGGQGPLLDTHPDRATLSTLKPSAPGEHKITEAESECEPHVFYFVHEHYDP